MICLYSQAKYKNHHRPKRCPGGRQKCKINGDLCSIIREEM